MLVPRHTHASSQGDKSIMLPTRVARLSLMDIAHEYAYLRSRAGHNQKASAELTKVQIQLENVHAEKVALEV
ncbi:hypothetical protein Tco_0521344 [Tanacetum coccineum]